MTNEELAALIQAGERERIGELWACVESFVSMMAGRCARQLEGYGGVTAEDLYQSGFLAVAAAVESYRPGQGGSFINWLSYHLKTAFAEAAGYRSRKRDPLNSAAGLEDPIPGTDGVSISDAIEDPAAALDFEDMEHRVWLEQLHGALETALTGIAEGQADILRRRFFRGQTLAEISAEKGRSPERIRQLERKALNALRHPRTARQLREFVDGQTDYYSGAGLGAFRRQGSQPERLTIWREEQERRFREQHQIAQ